MTPPVVVGSASRDLTADDPRGWRLGGAVTYAGLVLARLGLRPRLLIGVDAPASGAGELEWLRQAGADVRLVRLDEGPVFTNHDTPAGRAQICTTPGVPLPVAAIPTDWLTATTWFLVPVADEIDDSWAAVPPDEALVVIGWQGLLRLLPRGGMVARRPPHASGLMKRAGLVGMSRDDVDPELSGKAILAMLRAPVTLAITNASEGGLLFSVDHAGRHSVRRYPAIATDDLVDATGAGDAFLAGLVAGRLGHPLAGSGRRGSDVRLAAALGSLVVERPGLLGVPTMAAVAERLRRSLTKSAGPTAPTASTAPAAPTEPPG